MTEQTLSVPNPKPHPLTETQQRYVDIVPMGPVVAALVDYFRPDYADDAFAIAIPFADAVWTAHNKNLQKQSIPEPDGLWDNFRNACRAIGQRYLRTAPQGRDFTSAEVEEAKETLNAAIDEAAFKPSERRLKSPLVGVLPLPTRYPDHSRHEIYQAARSIAEDPTRLLGIIRTLNFSNIG